MNRIFTGCLLSVFLIFAGCERGLLAEPGLKAYSGNAVERRDTWLERFTQGQDANLVDVSKARSSKQVFQRIAVYVDPAKVEDMSKNNVAYSEPELAQLLTRATEDAVTQFGRFDRVVVREKASLIVSARLRSINAWADTTVSEKEAEAKYVPRGVEGTGALKEKINREAVDSFVTVAFSRPDGTVISSHPALGRLVATKGEAIESGTFTYQNGGNGKGKAVLEVTNAKIVPTQLPLVLTMAVDGAVAQSLYGQMDQLWDMQPDSTGTRVVRKSALGAVGSTLATPEDH